MFNVQQLQIGLSGLVGFFQPDDPVYMKIDPALTVSQSGKYIQRMHPLCTIENLQSVAPEFNGFQYPVFIPSASYHAGTVVCFSETLYKSKTAIIGGAGNPSVNVAGWALFDGFSDWLKRLYDGAVNNMANEFVRSKALRNVGRSLLDSQILYQGFGMLVDKIIKRGRFVGLEFVFRGIEQLLVRIDSVGLQLDANQTLTLYLYHSSQQQAIKEIVVVFDGSGSFKWVDLSDLLLSFLAKGYDTNGSFYLGYYEDDLIGQAINRQMDFGRMPCVGCNDSNVRAFNAWSRFVKMAAFEVPSTALPGDKSLFDVMQVQYPGNTNFGFNMSLSVMCDLTPFFLKNKTLFADALASQVALDIIKEIAFNTRLNAISDKTKALAMAELDDNAKSGSFYSQYLKQLGALDVNFSGFDSSCLPCVEKKGITYHAI